MKRSSSIWFGLAAAVFAFPAMADSAPDFTGAWGRNAFDLEAVPSAKFKPVNNTLLLPSGAGDPTRPIADYTNPILKPQAVEILKKRAAGATAGDISMDPSNQCAPQSPPFIFGMELGVQIMQGKSEITMLYNQDSQVRHIRMNATHPAHVAPSYMGDSIGRYEGDTLVVDTVGVKPGRIAVMDRYGTPFDETMHLVERYRFIDAGDAKAAQARHEKMAGRIPAMALDESYAKGLQLELTIENPAYFTAPLAALITYRHTNQPWGEQVCAENTREYYKERDTPIPRADKPDF
ncbi:MAG TPA: hypothetical protein VEU06_07285 [Micropepsaceae bacterium]|nr:hypothetical protein [Micropepsaceae bacterium]